MFSSVFAHGTQQEGGRLSTGRRGADLTRSRRLGPGLDLRPPDASCPIVLSRSTKPHTGEQSEKEAASGLCCVAATPTVSVSFCKETDGGHGGVFSESMILTLNRGLCAHACVLALTCQVSRGLPGASRRGMAARGQSREHGSQGSWAGAGELGQEHASHGAGGGGPGASPCDLPPPSTGLRACHVLDRVPWRRI